MLICSAVVNGIKSRLVTADHPASSYGIPVVVLPDGESLALSHGYSSTIKLRRPRQKSLMRSRLP